MFGIRAFRFTYTRNNSVRSSLNLVNRRCFKSFTQLSAVPTDDYTSGQQHVTMTNICENSECNAKRINSIVSKLSTRYKVTHNMQKVVEEMTKLSQGTGRITQLLSSNPKILQIPHGEINKVISTLLDYNFHPASIIHILDKFPEILKQETETITLCLENFRHMIGFTLADGTIQELFTKNPGLFHLDQYDLGEKLQLFSTWYTLGKIRRLIKMAPNVLSESEADIMDKYNYAYLRMGIDADIMLDAGLFAHSIEYIIARHQFLLRAGFYETPDVDGRTRRVKNPPLNLILNSYPRYFAQKLTDKTLRYRDFEVFKKMIEEESLERYLDFGVIDVLDVRSDGIKRKSRRIPRRQKVQDDDDEDSEEEDNDDTNSNAEDSDVTFYEVDENTGNIKHRWKK